MADQDHIPPKVMREEVMRRDRTLARAVGLAGLERVPGSLPVLEAFSQFLDAERVRNRNRMLTLIAAFVLFLLILTGAAFFAGSVLADRVRTETARLRVEWEGYRGETARRAVETQTALDRMQAEALNLRDSLSQQESAMANTRAEIDARKTDGERELADMRHVLERLTLDNAALRHELAGVHVKWPVLTRQMDKLLAEMETLRGSAAFETETQADTIRQPGVSYGGASFGGEAGDAPGFEMSLLPPGAGRQVTWRLPIPE